MCVERERDLEIECVFVSRDRESEERHKRTATG